MTIEKGQPGYIKARKMKYLIFAIVEFAIVAALVILGYVQTGSKTVSYTHLTLPTICSV